MIFKTLSRDLVCHVVLLATGSDKTSGTVYAYISRDSDGFYLRASGTWSAGAPVGAALPLATHTSQGLWTYQLSTGVTGALTVGDRIRCRMTDSETPATALTTSDLDVQDVDMTGDQVWDEPVAGHATTGTTGSTLLQIAGGAGAGSVPLNHDFPTDDYLRYVDGNGVPISGATIRVYASADWLAERYDRPWGSTVTGGDGRWVAPVMVAPHDRYYISFHLPGLFGPNLVTVTVP